jgi:hypothetical protein
MMQYGNLLDTVLASTLSNWRKPLKSSFMTVGAQGEMQNQNP